MAQASKSSGGKVYVQVSEVSNDKLTPDMIDLPSHLVDGFIVTTDLEKDHRHTNKYVVHDGLLGNSDYKHIFENEDDPLYKQIISKRALLEIDPNKNVILGQGVPELVGVYAQQNAEKY